MEKLLGSRILRNRYSWVSCHLVGTVTRPPSALKELGMELCADAVPDLSVLEIAVIYFFERRGLTSEGVDLYTLLGAGDNLHYYT